MFVAGFVGNQPQWTSLAQDWPKAIAPRKSLHLQSLRFLYDRDRRTLVRVGEAIRLSGVKPIIGGLFQGDYLPGVRGSDIERFLYG